MTDPLLRGLKDEHARLRHLREAALEILGDQVLSREEKLLDECPPASGVISLSVTVRQTGSPTADGLRLRCPLQ